MDNDIMNKLHTIANCLHLWHVQVKVFIPSKGSLHVRKNTAAAGQGHTEVTCLFYFGNEQVDLTFISNTVQSSQYDKHLALSDIQVTFFLLSFSSILYSKVCFQ